MQFDKIRERLLRLDAACVSDANKALRVMAPEIRPVHLGLKLVGKAHTVVCEEDFLTVIQALRDALPGEVLVVDTRGSRRAVAGELFATEAARKGLAGIVVDGAVRDTAKIRSLSIPVYSRAIIPVAGTTQTIFDTQIAVHCGGVTVNPGDILFGDDDGIVVATEREFIDALSDAEAIQGKEEAALSRMATGESLLGMLNVEEHLRARKANRESQLRFLS
jgi:RraA family protein